MIVHFYCAVGGHSVPAETASLLDLPEGWTQPRARLVAPPLGPDDPWEPGILYAADDGEPVNCCPHHSLMEGVRPS